MKKIITVVLMLAVCLSAQGVSRVISQSWDIANTPLSPVNMWFLQAESVQLDLTCLYESTPYPLTNDHTVVVWVISQGENYTNTLAVGTGTVISATGGVVRLTLTPEQSNLTNGTYNGYVIATTTDGTNITSRIVLCRQKIVIAWSPYGLEYEYAGLVTPFWTKAETLSLLYPISVFTNTQFSLNAWFASSLSNVSGRVASIEGSTSTWNTVTDKANQADFTSVSGRVAVIAGSTSTWNTVTDKANQADFTSVSGRVNVVESGFTSVSGRVAFSVAINGVTNTPNGGLINLGIIAGGETSSVTSIVLNGITNTPTDGLVDLGSIDIGRIIITNLSASQIFVSGAGDTNCNGTYICTNGLSGTNAYYWKGIFVIGIFPGSGNGQAWILHAGDEGNAYYYCDPENDPWINAWGAFDGRGSAPVISQGSEEAVVSITNSLQWVSAPTGSVYAGRSGQYSTSTSNFYFYSKAAVSGTTTGVWIRITGSVF